MAPQNQTAPTASHTRWTIAKRLFVLVAIFIAGMVVNGLVAYRAISSVKVGGPIYERIVLGKDLIADILPPPAYIIESYLVALQLADEPDVAARHKLTERLGQLEREFQTRHEFWATTLEASELRERLLRDSHEPAQQFYQVVAQQLRPAIEAGDTAAARSVVAGPLKQHYQAHRAAIDQVVALATERTSQTESQATGALRRHLTALTGAAVLTLAGVIVAGSLIGWRLTRGLRRVAVTLEREAAQVDQAAAQIASSAQTLAAGASQQAAALDESNGALGQITDMTRSTAAHAGQARERATAARTAADQGDATMERLNTAMQGINEASGQINRIIKAIEEIAFQTNLLALNAAVEAARAGEHGKGFAVVAEEVRNLAQRSASAARETTELIENAVSRARDGTNVAAEVGTALDTITRDITQVCELVDTISRTAGEQAQSVEQVHTAVGQMNQVTQRTAADAEESAAAAEQLSAQARSVTAVVGELAALVTRAGDSTAHAVEPPTNTL